MIDKKTAEAYKEKAQKEVIPSFVFDEIEYASKKGLSTISVPFKELEKLGKDPELVRKGLVALGYETYTSNDSWILFPNYILNIYF
jgi:hypothetical protein